MKKAILIPIIVGGSLLIAGFTVLSVGLAYSASDDGITNTYELTNQDISNFDFDLNVSDLEFFASVDGQKKVVCQESEKIVHTVEVADGTLKVRGADNRKWYEHIFSFNFTRKKVSVYLPAESYGDLLIRSDTGDIRIMSNFSFHSADIKLFTGCITYEASCQDALKIESSTGDIHLGMIHATTATIEASTGDIHLSRFAVDNGVSIKASTGRIYATGVTASDLTANTSTGDISFENTVIEGHLEAHSSTGDIRFRDSDAASLNIETTTGDVTGTLLSSKTFTVETRLGHINVPSSSTGGPCHIKTTTGDIEISIKA